MGKEWVSSPAAISVLLADSKQMESQLIASALQRSGFQVTTCDSDPGAILELAERGAINVAVISCIGVDTAARDMAPLRTLHLLHPEIPKIFLMDKDDRDIAVQAFRCGARG